jgi:PEP-CTERM/exosortase A-associated glycosyltransferase
MLRGWQVAAVTGPRHGTSAADVETVDGIDFHRTQAPPPIISPFGELRQIWAFARRIDAVVEAFEPDILHAHSPVLGALAALRVARKRGLPLLYEIRAFWEDAAVGNGTGREGSLRYRATHALETWAVRKVDAVAVICEGLRGDLLQRGIDPAKILVSPNGVDLSVFGDPLPHDTALARSLGLEGAEIVGFIGSFYDYEGLDDLIAAMPMLVDSRPNAHLMLVGGGPMEEALRAQAALSPVAEHIRFIGRVPHTEVDRYYSLADILAYPRKRMRLTDLVTPLKPLEAMAQRRLVAASDVGGHRELIRDGETGTLFPPGDPEAMARSIAGLLADRGAWEPRRERGRAFVEAERNWAVNVTRYASVYQKLTNSVPSTEAWSRPPIANA